MLAQVADAIVVIDVPIGIDLIAGAKPVFHQEQRFLIAVVHHVHGDAQAQRVDAPAPFAGRNVRVLQRLDDVGGIGVAGVHLRRGAARRVVAKGDEIDGVF